MNITKFLRQPILQNISGGCFWPYQRSMTGFFEWGDIWSPYHCFNPLSANPTKWSNTFKQFVGNLPKNCLSLFDHFVKLALKGISVALSDLAPFIQFKKCEKHQSRNFNNSTLLHGYFSRFLNCTNDTKTGNASHVSERQNL